MIDRHDQVIELLNNYQLPEAAALCRLAIRREPDPLQRTSLRCTLAHILEAQSQPNAARRLYRAVLAQIGNRRGLTGLRAKSWRGIGRTLRVQGSYREAELYLRRAVRAAESLMDTPTELADALGDLGVLYRYSGKLRQSEKLYRRALEITVAAVGPAHPNVAIIHHMLAGVNHVQGNLEVAEGHGRKAVEIRQAALGPDHPDTVADAACLAAILTDTGAVDEAEQILLHALKIFKRTYGEPHYEVAVTLHNLASIAHCKGRKRTAVNRFRRSLAMKEQLFGPAHPDLAMTLNNLAILESRPAYLDRAVAIVQAHLAPTHPTRLLIESNSIKQTQ